MEIYTSSRLFPIKIIYWKLFKKDLLKRLQRSIVSSKTVVTPQELNMMYSLGLTLDVVRATLKDLEKDGYITRR